MMYNIKKRVKMKKRKLPMTNVALFGSQSQGSQKVQCFTENLVHGSDSAESAKREIEIFFG